MRAALASLVVACLAAACARAMEPPEWQRRQQKMTEITTLWAQIRDWRRAAHMDLDPTPANMFQWRSRPVSEAARVIDEGLAQSQRDSFFVANLYTVQGEIHQARAAAFDADDAHKGAAIEERRAAIASYDKSIKINERLQKKLVEER